MWVQLRRKLAPAINPSKLFGCCARLGGVDQINPAELRNYAFDGSIFINYVTSLANSYFSSFCGILPSNIWFTSIRKNQQLGQQAQWEGT